ncbi:MULTISPECIES: AMP-binding protein [unclassified Lysobacter]|uniref:AMP-binding protein n=1 Tax=unclassified Lysobacter TaxID=2635362 RepID=UPI001BEC1CB7|nr:MULTISPECIES: AMP-binding protein [unclassified Lysobacter]MBT2747132.1 AMP-binding protein [Lysobacter sp. ISL-42]MBT2752938.1 AMP-binding protein [Lysobacter sp. ISL-50]MBT2778901.1 AMP-binding protein [Lysobacter sp. ISL-54]MBT2784205.1 AMP-binding protein [Lysobacter sp. ISL-52]
MSHDLPTAPDPALSHVVGATAPPLLEETIGAMLARVAATWPEREALVVPPQGVRLSWSAFDAAVSRLAAGLLKLGLAPGDRIGVWSLNRAEWVLLQFASARVGLILVNINPAYRTHELEYALNLVACRALAIVPSFKTSHYLQMLRELAPELDAHPPGLLRSRRLPDLRHVLSMGPGEPPAGTHAFDAVAACDDADAHARLREVAALLSPDDAVNIQFTSGTTGAPKGATLTHRNIVNNGFFVGEAMRLSEHDRLCIPVPFYHCFGMVLGNMACVTHGACMVIPGEGFDPLVALRTVAEERCTGLHGVPTMFIGELEHPRFGEFDLSSLRTGIMAGSNCPIEVMKQVVERMHMQQVTIAYGMTETSPVSFQTVPADPLARRVDSVGRVHPHVEVRIVDEHGATVPRGEIGELLTRGYSVMQGYWGDPKRSAEAIDAEGWMHTGDQAVIDADGYAHIVGRLKDMLIRGGENVYPREIEEFLYAHPAIADVQVFGVPDAKFGEEVCAWIRLAEGASLDAEAVRAFCQGRIAQYKIPRYIEFVDSLPMTISGKPQKFLMRERMAERLAAAAGDG